MKIHYTFDDSAARLPLTIRSSEGVWDRASDIRNAPSIHLVELTTQHMLNTGTVLLDELTNYFEKGTPSETDPYSLADCFANRDQLQDLLRDLRDNPQHLTAFAEVEALFPVTYMQDLQLTLALTTVGIPAFGYVRTFKDSEGEEFHGMVVNLTQARPHLENYLGQFSLSLLVDMIRFGFFNHEAFQLAYGDYAASLGRGVGIEKPIDRLKELLLRRGIAWYLSYRHNLEFYDQALNLDANNLGGYIERWNGAVEAARKKGQPDDPLDDLRRDASQPEDIVLDLVGFYMARGIAEHHGNKGLRELVTQGPDHFITLYNELSKHKLKN